MARDQKLNVEITATDKASAKITDVAKKVDKTDGKKATVKVDADTKDFTDGVDGLNDHLDDALAKVRDIGGRGKAGGVLAIGAGLFAAVDHAADLAVEVGNLKALTGDTAEDASRLNGVWKQAGFDAKDLQDVVLQMNGVLSTSPDLAKKLGINLNDGKTIGERFQQVVQILGDDFTDAGERSQLASQLFGEEGVRQVTAVEQAFGDLTTAVEDYQGAVLSESDITRLRELKQQSAEVKAEFEQMAVKAGVGLLDIKDGVETASTAVGKFIRGIALNDGDIFKNWGIERAVEQAEDQFRAFDMTLVENARTIEDVRKIATDYGLDLHAVNLVAVQWARTHEDAAEATVDLGDKAANAALATGDLAEVEKMVADNAAKERGELQQLTDQYNAQRRSADDLYNAKLQLVGGDLRVRDAQRQARQSASELDETLAGLKAGTDEYQGALDAATQEQLVAATAAGDLRLEQMKANGSIVDGKVKAQVYKEELQKLAAQTTGPLHDAILGLIADIGAIKDKTVNLTVLANGRKVNVGGGLAIGGGIIQDGPDTSGAAPTLRSPGAGQSAGPAVSNGGGGTVINLTVNAGMGADGRLIGRQIVQALTEYKRAGGRLTF